MVKLTQEYVRSLFNYKDGELYWAVSKQGIKLGDVVDTVGYHGYKQVMVNYKTYKVHRLIFLYHHGYLPEYLDHIDCDKLNNDISNLREATLSQNQWNQKKQKSYCGKPTSSIFKGVSWHKSLKKWHVRISIDGKDKHLGYFISEIEAAKSYDRAASEAFGEFAKVNLNYDL